MFLLLCGEKVCECSIVCLFLKVVLCVCLLLMFDSLSGRPMTSLLSVTQIIW